MSCVLEIEEETVENPKRSEGPAGASFHPSASASVVCLVSNTHRSEICVRHDVKHDTGSIGVILLASETRFDQVLNRMATLSKCQLCDQSGHIAKSCPNRAAKRQRCQLCDQLGHLAIDCPNDDPEEEQEEEEEDGDVDAGAKPCPVCEAAANEVCEISCETGGSHRNDSIGLRKARAQAASGTQKSKVAKLEVEGSVKGPLTPAEILALDVPKLIQLKVRQILLLPPVWRAWIWGRSPSSRVDAHRQLMDALRAVMRVQDEKTDTGQFSASDIHHAKEALEMVENLLDPRPDMSIAAHIARIDAATVARGMDLLAFKDARTHSWKVVRRAQDIYSGEQSQDKAWTAALTRAETEAKREESARKEKARPTQQRGGGKGRRGQRGGSASGSPKGGGASTKSN